MPLYPFGWRKRLVRFRTPATHPVTALCLEPHDLWVSKAIAGRPKDREFCQALLDRRLVESTTLRKRLASVPELNEKTHRRVAG